MSSPVSLEELIQIANEVAGDPHRFAVYYDDPVGFVEDILGITLWQKQKDALNLAAKNARVAVRSGHSVGKTLTAACLVIWWLYARKGLVFTTAPTKEHVESVLWREIGIRWRGALVPLPGQCFNTQLVVEKGWYAEGITTDQAGAFQGRHHEHLLIVIDESAGVGELIFEEISTCVSGPKNCLFMIGNPTTMSGSFYQAFNRPGRWAKLHISCLDHPNVVHRQEIIPGAVSWEWVEEQREKYGENSPFWFSRVLGEFPRISIKGVIPLMWLERAVNEEERKKALAEAEAANIPRVGGLDVARYGDNLCVFIVRRGDAVEHIESWSHATLTETTGKAVRYVNEWKLQTLVVDASGIGAGVVDRLVEQSVPVLGFNSGHRAFTPASFGNRRSELWWSVRTRLEKKRLWLPRGCEQLIADLVAPEYHINSSGRLVVESKEKLLERGVPSPDYGDALIQCFAMDEDPTTPEQIVKSPDRDHTAIYTVVEDNMFSGLPGGF